MWNVIEIDLDTKQTENFTVTSPLEYIDDLRVNYYYIQNTINENEVLIMCEGNIRYYFWR